MAVPTIYSHFLQYHSKQNKETQIKFSNKCKQMRLMISGSAALRVSTLDQWKKISGHILLERYGMSEIGMAISNPYHGERRAGHIVSPFKNTLIQLLDDDNHIINKENIKGEIHVKSETLFKYYWNKPIQSQEAFTKEGWFKTGDIAIISNGYYKIVGRKSVDIIKSGAYKISALEIEEQIRTFPKVNDCAVIGLEDEVWGEIICVMIECNFEIKATEISQYLTDLLPKNKLPRKFLSTKQLPRNAMGKVLKNEIKTYFNQK